MVGPVRVSRGWGVAGSCDGRGVLGHVGGHVLDHVMGWGVAGSCDGRGVLGHVWDYMLGHVTE